MASRVKNRQQLFLQPLRKRTTFNLRQMMNRDSIQMAKRQIFYSFHYDKDVWRVQQIRNMHVIEGNEPISKNAWEDVEAGGDAKIQKWIDDNLRYRSCLIVLIGSDTAGRKWIDYEIKKAWKDGKGVFGIYIHNLGDSIGKTDTKGKNPFLGTNFTKNGNSVTLATYDPPSTNVINTLKANIESWIEIAIKQAS